MAAPAKKNAVLEQVVERKAIADLKAAPWNPRRISPAALAGLTASLKRFGYVEPVIWNKRSGYLVGGHQRVKALKAEGVKDLPVVVVDLDETDEKALNVALNNPHISGEFDATLQLLLEELRGADEMLFRELRLDELLGASESPESLSDPEAIPEVPKVAKTKPGDIYELGEHRLICGDSSDPATIAKLLDGRKMNLVVTSPPYASQRKYDESTAFRPIHPDAYVDWFEPFALRIRENLEQGGSFFLNIKENADDGELVTYVMELVLDLKKRLGFRYVEQFMWTHGGTPKAVQQRFKNGFEPIFQFTTTSPHKFRPDDVRHATNDVPDWGGAHPSQNDGLTSTAEAERSVRSKQRTQTSKAQGRPYTDTGNPAILAEGLDLAYPSNVLSLGKNREALGHGAAFPVKLPDFFIRAYTDPGDIVFDPFGGSGTVLIAADKLQRAARLVEISPLYCDVIVERWETFTGRKAVLHHG